MQLEFTINEIIPRATIHNAYGGNRQSGISVSAAYPCIFIFSGASGQKHGYKDRWENENIFSYTGEGQLGDMSFVRGNLALLEHKNNHRKVFLFEYIAKGLVQYKGELVLQDYDYFDSPDSNGALRKAIKFFFQRQGVPLGYEADFGDLTLKAPPAIYQADVPNITERQGLVTSRVGQGAYRKSVLHRWKYACAVTGYEKREVLIASHIVPWKDASNEERLDVNNGILLSPVFDALFDQHLISFENEGKIILSDRLIASNFDKLGVSGHEMIRNLSLENHLYLDRHRSIMAL